jgi:hypothetical protein
VKRRSITTAVIAAMTLAVAVAMNAVPATAATASSGAIWNSSLSGQVVLQGRVTYADGRAVAGARVLLYAWPGSWPGKRNLHDGEQVPMRLVGKTLSATGGQYAVRISAPAALKASAAPGGIVNLQADVVGTRAGTSLYPFSLRIRSTPSGPVLTRLWVRESPHGALQTAVLRVSGARTSAAIAQDFCYDAHTSFVKNYAAEWANLDATYMRFSGVKGWVDYETGQDSTFSVGVSSSADKGSFSAGAAWFANRRPWPPHGNKHTARRLLRPRDRWRHVLQSSFNGINYLGRNGYQ